MSIFTRKISAALLCSFVLATPLSAQTTSATLLSVAELPEKDIRRISYYSAQTLEAMHAFGSNAEAEGALEALRSKVQRLTDAGQRSGLTTNTTADYFSAFIAENNVAPLPIAFLDDGGQFDAVSLLNSVEIFYSNEVPQAFDVEASEQADMAAISSVAQQRAPQVAVVQSAELTVVEVSAVVFETPAIAANAPANVRAILERVELNGEDWVITVKQGDSLGQYANALYGDTKLFQQIFEANLGVLITPNSIRVGQNIVLPRGLL